jgi:hypothetical protein
MMSKEGADAKDPQKHCEEYANKTGLEQHWECLLDEDTLFDFSWPEVQRSKLRGNLLPSIHIIMSFSSSQASTSPAQQSGTTARSST